MDIKTLSIDLETRSGADISKAGLYRYAEDPDFDVLLFGVSVNHGPVEVYDLANNDTIPEEILAALSDNNVTKFAYNASFERICLSEWLKRYHPEHFKSYGMPAATSLPTRINFPRYLPCVLLPSHSFAR